MGLPLDTHWRLSHAPAHRPVARHHGPAGRRRLLQVPAPEGKPLRRDEGIASVSVQSIRPRFLPGCGTHFSGTATLLVSAMMKKPPCGATGLRPAQTAPIGDHTEWRAIEDTRRLNAPAISDVTHTRTSSLASAARGPTPTSRGVSRGLIGCPDSPADASPCMRIPRFLLYSAHSHA
jgi:hypothetical protein